MNLEPSTETHPIRILHVEDDLDHAELVRRSFAGHRIANTIEHVVSGEQALDYLFRRGSYADPDSSPRPDVVLLDLRLPGIDGLQVLEQIRASERLRRLPVVVLTTSEADSDKLKAYEEHISAYLVKPMEFDSFEVLLSVISMVLRKVQGESR